MTKPGVTIPFLTQGSREALINSNIEGIPITIMSDIAVFQIGPALYARLDASPYKAKPFMQVANITDPTNTTNATVDIPDADAALFTVGDKITYWDTSAGSLYTGAEMTLDIIGAAGSGTGGAGFTLLTFTGETWTTPPVATDKLCVADGSELSKNAVLVLEDVVLTGGTNEVLATGYFKATADASKVYNTTYFEQHLNQNLLLINIS